MPKSEKIRVMISSRCKASIPYKGKPALLSELRKLLKKEIESLVLWPGQNTLFDCWINEDSAGAPMNETWWEHCEVYSSGKSAFTNLANFPAALMYGAQVDQDINCRTVGRCLHGAPIDRELGDLIPRREEDGATKEIPLSENLGRQFLYARYNAELSARWLSAHGLGDVDAAKVAKLDSVEHIQDLVRVGQALAEEVKLEHFVLDRFGEFYKAVH